MEVEAFAAELGLEVWFSPYPLELTPGEILSSFSDCAEREQRLWKRGGLAPERRVCGSLLPSRVSCRQWGKRQPAGVAEAGRSGGAFTARSTRIPWSALRITTRQKAPLSCIRSEAGRRGAAM